MKMIEFIKLSSSQQGSEGSDPNSFGLHISVNYKILSCDDNICLNFKKPNFVMLGRKICSKISSTSKRLIFKNRKLYKLWAYIDRVPYFH